LHRGKDHDATNVILFIAFIIFVTLPSSRDASYNKIYLLIAIAPD